jgi:hypothetical protein
MLILKHIKNIKNNQSMIKKLCASHQEIKIIAEYVLEGENK